MKILVINSGSSSVKYQLFRISDWTVCASGSVTRIGEVEGDFNHYWTDASPQRHELAEIHPIADHREGIARIIRALTETGGLDAVAELRAIGHRVVHGGEAFSKPTLIEERVLQAVEEMVPLAPLHNPANLEGIQVSRSLFPAVPQVAVFDTAFHQSMPPESYRYAVPDYLYREHRVRRYGFHGTSHQYVSRQAAAFLNIPLEQVNLITMHLGNGASAAAVRNGRCFDTSMGMTPLEGLVMGTRSGDIDPAIHSYLCRELGYSVHDVDRLLNKESGLFGLAGVNDMREIHSMADAGDRGARLALRIFAHRLKKYLGAYYAELGRVDAVVFTGGIGENDARMRERVCADLEPLGIVLDQVANKSKNRGQGAISPAHGRVQVLVIPTNEELEIARQAWDAVAA